MFYHSYGHATMLDEWEGATNGMFPLAIIEEEGRAL